MHIEFWWKSQKNEKAHYEDLDMGGRIVKKKTDFYGNSMGLCGLD
jgi:hypothetical protein